MLIVAHSHAVQARTSRRRNADVGALANPDVV